MQDLSYKLAASHVAIAEQLCSFQTLPVLR